MTESLNDISQEDYDQAEATVISLLRSSMPNLDLRRGTVLRDLLVRPAAAFYALESGRIGTQQLTRSLALMAESPDEVTGDDVNAVLSNFSITQRLGTYARGTVQVFVAYDRTYTIPATTEFTTLDGHTYSVDAAFTASTSPGLEDLALHQAADGINFFFFLPITSTTVGVAAELGTGTALDLTGSIDGFISAGTYGPLTGGTDAEAIKDVIERLPTAIAHRSLESRTSIEAILRSDEHGGFGGTLEAVSIQGYGDETQLRDKHNAMGVAMGGKVDIYARTFFTPHVVTIEKIGTQVAPNSYSISISTTDAPGYYAIKSVSDTDVQQADGETTDIPVLGSYDTYDIRSFHNINGTSHDIDATNGIIETAHTVYQTSIILVNDVADASAAERPFKVELYAAPFIKELQDYVDDQSVRNVKADYLVRCPMVCQVGLRVTVVPDKTAGVLDVGAVAATVADYINSRSFTGKLAASEIVNLLHDYPIKRVDLSDDPISGFQLVGTVRDAAGNILTLTGPTLDINTVANPDHLLTSDTCVFATVVDDIYIETHDE